MKKFSFSKWILIILITCCFVNLAKAYQITGKIKGIEDASIEFVYLELGKGWQVFNSAQITNGKFEITGDDAAPIELRAKIKPGNFEFTFWFENSIERITGDADKAKINRWEIKEIDVKIKGGNIQKEEEAFRELFASVNKEMAVLDNEFNIVRKKMIEGKKNGISKEESIELSKTMEEIKRQKAPFNAKIRKITDQYIKDHPQSFISSKLISRRMGRYTVEEARAIYDQFPEGVKNGFFGVQIKKEIDKKADSSPGGIAPSFAKKDINGEMLRLSEFKGRYVLLDFWASWCKPCRAGNPHLIELYKKYHARGIEFIGIAADDKTQAAWRKAIEQDKIGIWRHILTGERNAPDNINNAYGVHTVPTKVLINPEGKVIGRYGADGGNDADIDKKFEELFSEN